LRDDIIGRDFDNRWLAPVWVRVGHGMAEPVWGPKQALDYLCHRWPSARGRHYLGARATCVAAARNQLASEYARESFIRASIEAAMLD
jgi:hypothetical protein